MNHLYDKSSIDIEKLYRLKNFFVCIYDELLLYVIDSIVEYDNKEPLIFNKDTITQSSYLLSYVYSRYAYTLDVVDYTYQEEKVIIKTVFVYDFEELCGIVQKGEQFLYIVFSKQQQNINIDTDIDIDTNIDSDTDIDKYIDIDADIDVDTDADVDTDNIFCGFGVNINDLWKETKCSNKILITQIKRIINEKMIINKDTAKKLDIVPMTYNVYLSDKQIIDMLQKEIISVMYFAFCKINENRNESKTELKRYINEFVDINYKDRVIKKQKYEFKINLNITDVIIENITSIVNFIVLYDMNIHSSHENGEKFISNIIKTVSNMTNTAYNTYVLIKICLVKTDEIVFKKMIKR